MCPSSSRWACFASHLYLYIYPGQTLPTFPFSYHITYSETQPNTHTLNSIMTPNNNLNMVHAGMALDIFIGAAPAFPGVLPQQVDLCTSRAQLSHIANHFWTGQEYNNTRKAYEEFTATLTTQTGDCLGTSDERILHPRVDVNTIRVPLEDVPDRDLEYLLQILWS